MMLRLRCKAFREVFGKTSNGESGSAHIQKHKYFVWQTRDFRVFAGAPKSVITVLVPVGVR